MAIKIKRSTGNLAPAELAAGQLAYVEGSSNGGTLYYGEIGGTVREIGGRKFVDKLNGIEAGAQVNTVTSVAGRTGDVTIATTDVSGFNTAVDARITSGAVTGALGFTPISSTEKGANNGVATLDSAGKVPSTQLPSFVDDVVEGANLAAFPSTGETSKIYVAVDTGKTYRWSGSTYVEISASPGSTDSVTEGSTNLYFTNGRARSAISATQNLTYDSATGVITGPDLSGYALSSSLATVATSGSYADLTNKPTLFSGAYEDLTGKPSLFSGSYTDLTNKPTLFSGAYADLTGKPDLSVYQLAANAFSGSYTDLTNKPTLFTDVVQDTTPQLGGNLDVLTRSIETSTTNGSITLKPNGTGSVVISGANAANSTGVLEVDDIVGPGAGGLFVGTTSGNIELESAANVIIQGLQYPNADGTANQVLKTNGSGVLSWVTQTAGVTEFTGLSDVPSSFTGSGGYYVKVNSGATALEFSQDVDDGTF